MNPHLQDILNYLEREVRLDFKQKEGVLKLLKQADKDFYYSRL